MLWTSRLVTHTLFSGITLLKTDVSRIGWLADRDTGARDENAI